MKTSSETSTSRMPLALRSRLLLLLRVVAVVVSIVVAVVVGIAVSACSQTSPSTAKPGPKSTEAAAEANPEAAVKVSGKIGRQRSPGRGTQQVLANYYKALASRDTDWLPSFFAEDYRRTRVDPIPGSNPSMSRQQYLDGLKFFFDKLPSSAVTPLLLLTEANRSAAIYRIESGNGTSIVHAEVAEHDSDGAIRSSRLYSSDLEFLAQAGVRAREGAFGTPPTWPPLAAIAAQGSEVEQSNVALAKRLTSALDQNRTRGLSKLVADDIATFKHNGSNHSRGLAKMRAEIASSRQFSLRKQREVVSSWAAGDWVVIESTLTVTPSQGTLRGIPIRETTVMFFRVAGGRIVEVHIMGNEVFVWIQVGLDDAADLRADLQKAFSRLFSGCDDIRNCTSSYPQVKPKTE